MTALPRLWRAGHVPKVDDVSEHAELVAWEAAEDALRGNRGCVAGCYDSASMEWSLAEPCDFCKATFLAEIDLDGHDDKREIGAA